MSRHTSIGRAFTLVELLVVIGLIVILIAILLPVLSRVKQQAQQLRCAANLSQIGHAFTIYTGEFGFSPAAGLDCVAGMAECWPVRLRNILKGNQDIFYCPAQDARCQWKPDAPGSVEFAVEWDTNFGYKLGERLLVYRDMYFSYGINGHGAIGDGTIGGLGGGLYSRPSFRDVAHIARKASSVKSPSELIIIADTTADGVEDYQIGPYPRNLGETGGPSYAPATIHRGGANVLFYDGHVEWYLQRDLLCQLPQVKEEGRKQQMWNIDNQPARHW